MDMTQIKRLRDETGAGMLDCKKALESSSGDYENALNFLQNLTHKNDGNTRVASKGLCRVVIDQNHAILFEVNAETDFVSKNEHFIKLMEDLGTNLIKSKATNPKDAQLVIIDNISVKQKILQVSSIIKENAQLRRFYRVIKSDEQGFGSYIHQGGKIVTLVILDQKNQEIADTLAMQVAANSPLYLDPKAIDSNTLDYEKMMYEKSHPSSDQNQFENYLNDISLLTQSYIKNPDMKVTDLLEKNHLKVIDFFRFELGQGIDNKLNCKLDVPCDGSPITVMPIY